MASRFLTSFRGAEPLFGFPRDFQRLFDDFLPQGRGSDGGFFNPDVDVAETDKEIRISVDLPGVDQKDVDVSLEDDLLVIRGEKHDERTEDRGDYKMSERSFGSFQRALRLPVRIDPEKIRANFDKGVLKVMVPKEDGAGRGKKISIGGGQAIGGGQDQVIDQTATPLDRPVTD